MRERPKSMHEISLEWEIYVREHEEKKSKPKNQ